MIKALRAGFALVFLVGLLAGCGTAPLLKGNEAFRAGDFKAAEAQWKPMAEAGNFHAQHNLGVLYKTVGDSEIAAFWWQRAVASDFVPSMLELGTMKLADGEREAAAALFRRAARWGNADAIAALEALDKSVPRADLFFAEMRRLELQQVRAAWRSDRRRSAEEQQDAVDYAATLAANDD